MQSVGKFVFKSLEKKDGGKFINEKGQEVVYDSSYQLRIDENKNGVVSERKLKISQKNDILIQKLMKLKTYDPIYLKCDIDFYGSVAKVVPIDLVDSDNK